MSDPNVSPTETPRRRDARANREAILAAAADAWSDAGFDVGLVEIARRAGVGSATLYRHFGTREALVAAVYGERIVALGSGTRRAGACPDAWEALASILELVLEAGAGDRGLRQLVAVGFGATPTRVVQSTAIAEQLRALGGVADVVTPAVGRIAALVKGTV